MPVEKDHPYIANLQPDTLITLANNRDLNGINRFIYRLVHDLPYESEDFKFTNIMCNPNLTSVVNGYLEQAEESGKINRCLNYLLFRNPNIDIHDAEEIVYFSVWKSFFTYPWEEGYVEKKFNTYLYNSIQQLSRDVRERNNVPLDLEEGEISQGNSTLHFDTFLSETPINPEDHLLQKSAQEELINALVEATTNGREELKEIKTKALNLLAQGIEPIEITDLLGIEYARLKTWLRACKKVNIINTSDRVDTNANGSWHWSQKTAQAILGNTRVVCLLNNRELEILKQLSEGKSYTKITQIDPTLNGAEHEIKHKLRSHGVNKNISQETYLPRRRQLLMFLDTIEPVNDDEKNLIQAIRKAKGNIYEAARYLDLPRNKVLYYLKERGYFRK